jgi:hypothetical protein
MSDLDSRRAFLLASLPWSEKQLGLSHVCIERLRILVENTTKLEAWYDQPEEDAEGALLLCGHMMVAGEYVIFSCEFKGGPIFQNDEAVARAIVSIAGVTVRG